MLLHTTTLARALGANSPLKRVLVTGGNKGIGKAVCKELLFEHRDLYVILGSRDDSRGEAAVADILTGAPPGSEERIQLLSLDVSNEASVLTGAEEIRTQFGPESLYGIVNNAGIGFGRSIEETLETNFYGTQRVCSSFIDLLMPDEGRIVNIASASGPNYLAKMNPATRKLFVDPMTTWEELDAVMKEAAGQVDYDGIAYGLSKAGVNTFTAQLAKAHPNLRINSCTPGWILTDLTRGMGASNPPEAGTKAILHCLLGDLEGNGWYYGSDAVRSPLDRYRNPGDPPYTPE